MNTYIMLFVLAIPIFINCLCIDTVCGLSWIPSTTENPPTKITPIIDWFTTRIPTVCSQSQIHLQQHFCDPNRAVVKAKIIKKLNDYDYSIHIFKVFRGHYKLISKTRLFNNKYCPAAFTVGETYLITGELKFEGSEFEFHTSSGDWVEPFDNVSVIQKFGLRSYFKQTCGKICEIKSCSGADCSVVDENACKMDAGLNQSITQCYTHKSVCRRPRKRCVWRSWDMTKDENGRKFQRINCN